MAITDGKGLSAWLKPKLPELHRHSGIIFAVDKSDFARNKGTVTFVNIEGINGLLTAFHVYKELKDQNTIIFYNFEEQTIKLPEIEFYSETLDYVWIPIELVTKVNNDLILFFVTKFSREINERLFNEFKSISAGTIDEKPSNLLINGAPNFAYKHDIATGIQHISLQPVHVSVPQFNKFLSVYDENQKIVVQFDANKLKVDNEEFENEFKDYFKSPPNYSFGGYSGGPACIFGYDGFFLIGIISQCVNFSNHYNVLISPIAAIIEDIYRKMRAARL